MHDKMQYDLLVHLVLLVLLLWSSSTTTVASGAETPMAKHNCATHCGDISIPYPFGIGPNKDCYFDEWFEMVCNQSSSTSPHKLYLRRAQLEVLNVYANGTLRVNNPIAFFCQEYRGQQPADLSGGPFVYSGRRNKFTAVSCDYLAFVSSEKYLVGGCRSICEGTSISPENCEIGVNCCQTNIPPHLSVISTDIEDDRTARVCTKKKYAFLVDEEWFRNNFMASNFSVLEDMDSVPVVLDWSLGLDNTSLRLFQRFIRQHDSRAYDDPTPTCKIKNVTSTSRASLECSCPRGFEGNPYLGYHCHDIDECTDHNRCGPRAPHCLNYNGTYECHRHIVGGKTKIKLILIGLGAGVGLLLLLIGAWWVHEVLKKRKRIKRKEFFFKRNGGLLLEQQLSSGEVNVEKIKLFKSKELEKSTDNFNTDRILGQGGQGTVYKGMLADGRIVAVKKSKIVDESQLSGFINEVVILSQINHRNVVQLLGCCLETEVPILVYEFIPNGNLSQYIHEQNEEFPLTWEVRLRIAKEIAGALSYLHASAAFPIYHRDIKSTNILLDAKYRAKVADFGTSRSVAIDQTHLTTLVHGTFGYLDPEYFQSSQFTEKSDVYSFGVVLVELLTGQKPISFRRSQEEGKSLATYFIISMQLDRLFEILDAQVVKGGSKADIITVANLARRCLNLSGRKRPTMREVTAELEGIQTSEKTSNGEQNYEEVEYVRTESIEPWDVVSSSTSTRPGLDGGPASSLHEVPLLPFTSR
ncbi:PREDICTED: wall-associated [Prunus dulcis]|uniref:PREDICTED: wall-associated n=1 Tax=Prunus dulcis TaxID=3755 RepID=A0A5E4FJ05_PRUDU|nr:wall-associated receptor kinase-like 8 [Prunus dulcis]VVA27802.1 PREDICTED: wall-associated [Prunus dulcis]